MQDEPLHADHPLKLGYDAGVAAAKEELQIGAQFRGCGGSLRYRQGGSGYERDDYSIAFRSGYMYMLGLLVVKIFTNDEGVITRLELKA
jgi:hypothetical protein